MVSKGIATVLLWIVMGTISIIAVTNAVLLEDWAVVAMGIIPLILATISTGFIWVASEALKYNRIGSQEPEKAKRGDGRVQMLLEMMDDDEREAFKQELKEEILQSSRLSDDGELPTTLSDLMDEKQLRS